MANSKHVRLFRRAAERRLDDARFLAKSGEVERMTGAVYLAGYAVECGLKALLLSRTPAARQAGLMNDSGGPFRGKRGHDVRALRIRCEAAGTPLPAAERDRLLELHRWDTDMRYNPADTDADEAAVFLDAAGTFLQFVKRSL